MKTIATNLAAILFAFGICANGNAQDQSHKSPADAGREALEGKETRNKRVALENAKAIQRHDIESAAEAFAPEIINYGNGKIPPQKGIDAVTASLKMFVKAFPIERIDNLVAIAEGDWVMLWGQWSGIWKEDFMGQKATGQSFSKMDVEIYRFNDEGKIIEHHSVQSFDEIARQIGLRPPSKE